jgi:hypothetical protein
MGLFEGKGTRTSLCERERASVGPLHHHLWHYILDLHYSMLLL